jgi:hypothetical protein
LLLKNPKSEDLVYTLPKKKKPLLQNFVFLWQLKIWDSNQFVSEQHSQR